MLELASWDGGRGIRKGFSELHHDGRTIGVPELDEFVAEPHLNESAGHSSCASTTMEPIANVAVAAARTAEAIRYLPRFMVPLSAK